MQRYSSGLAVGRNQMDRFVSKATDATGSVTCELTYEPKSIDDLVVSDIWSNPFVEHYIPYPYNLVGTTLKIRLFDTYYLKADTPAGAANSGGAGADPHTHPISHTIKRAGHQAVATQDLLPFTVTYKVA